MGGGIKNILISESWLIIGGIIGIVALISLFHLIPDNIIYNSLETIGRYTLGIYLIQGVIFNSIFVYDHIQVNNDLGYFFIAIGITTISYLFNKLIILTPIGRFSLGLK